MLHHMIPSLNVTASVCVGIASSIDVLFNFYVWVFPVCISRDRLAFTTTCASAASDYARLLHQILYPKVMSNNNGKCN